MGDAAHRDPEWLALAQTLGLTQREAAVAAGVSRDTIQHWEEEHGLVRGRCKGDPRLADADWLREQYRGEERSTYDIADELRCGSRAVFQRLRSFGIATRPRSQHAVTDDELGVAFDSRWERDVARALESRGADWERHPERMEGWEPDLLVGGQTYVEVKGRVDHGDGATQYAGMAAPRWAGAEVVVVGDKRARDALPHDRFVPYDGTGDMRGEL